MSKLEALGFQEFLKFYKFRFRQKISKIPVLFRIFTRYKKL